jgi:hypothetical protein
MGECKVLAIRHSEIKGKGRGEKRLRAIKTAERLEVRTVTDSMQLGLPKKEKRPQSHPFLPMSLLPLQSERQWHSVR